MSCMMIFFFFFWHGMRFEFYCTFSMTIESCWALCPGLCVQSSVAWKGEAMQQAVHMERLPEESSDQWPSRNGCKNPFRTEPCPCCCQPSVLDCPWVTGRKRGWWLQLTSTILRWNSGSYKPSSTISGLGKPFSTPPPGCFPQTGSTFCQKQASATVSVWECLRRLLHSEAGIPREPARKCWRSMQGPAQIEVPWMSPPMVWWLNKNMNI